MKAFGDNGNAVSLGAVAGSHKQQHLKDDKFDTADQKNRTLALEQKKAQQDAIRKQQPSVEGAAAMRVPDPKELKKDSL